MYLNESGIIMVNEFTNIIYNESLIKPPLDLNSYKFEDFREIFGGNVRIKMYHSLNKNCSFFKNLEFHGVKIK